MDLCTVAHQHIWDINLTISTFFKVLSQNLLVGTNVVRPEIQYPISESRIEVGHSQYDTSVSRAQFGSS